MQVFQWEMFGSRPTKSMLVCTQRAVESEPTAPCPSPAQRAPVSEKEAKWRADSEQKAVHCQN